jgi:restriction endonuclease S subunit
MKISIVNFDKVKKADSYRFDAEYFHPTALLYEDRISKFRGKTLKQYECQVVSGPFGSSLTSDVYLKEGIPFIRISDLKDFIIDESQLIYISKSDHDRLSSSRMNVGDLVLSKVGNSIGLVSIIPDHVGESNISENNIGIRFPKDIVQDQKRFILTYLNSASGQSQILRCISGNAQPKLNVSDVKDIVVPQLSTSLVKRISDIVVIASSLIGQSKSSYSQAEQILLSEMGLLDWNPKHKLSFIKNYSDTSNADRIDAEYFQPMYEEIEKAIIACHRLVFLGELASIKKSIEPGSEAYQDKGVPFLRVSNLSKFEINHDNQQFISEDLYRQLLQHQPQIGEILLSKDATPGIAFYLLDEPAKMIPSSGILRLKIHKDQEVLPEYLTLVINSILVQKQINRDVGGSVINHWLVNQVKNALIPILPFKKQQDIAGKISASFANRKMSKSLLEIAKRGVEIAIEKNEQEAEKWINAELKRLAVELN